MHSLSFDIFLYSAVWHLIFMIQTDRYSQISTSNMFHLQMHEILVKCVMDVSSSWHFFFLLRLWLMRACLCVCCRERLSWLWRLWMRRKRMRDLLEKAEMNQIWIQNWILPSNWFLPFVFLLFCVWIEGHHKICFSFQLLRRPEMSFFWFSNPCKTCKFIVWRRFKWVIIGLVVLILVLLFIGILLFSLPVRTHFISPVGNLHLTCNVYNANSFSVFFRTIFPWKSSNPSIKFRRSSTFCHFIHVVGMI